MHHFLAIKYIWLELILTVEYKVHNFTDKKIKTAIFF